MADLESSATLSVRIGALHLSPFTLNFRFQYALNFRFNNSIEVKYVEHIPGSRSR